MIEILSVFAAVLVTVFMGVMAVGFFLAAELDRPNRPHRRAQIEERDR